MPCINCLSEDCNFVFKCQMKCDTCCNECLPTFLTMTMAKRFKNQRCKCIFCFEKIADNCKFVLSNGSLTLDDFGIQPILPSSNSTILSTQALHFANCHYAFDLLMGISFPRVQFIEETELFNAYEYFGGLCGMIDLAKGNINNEMVMKDVGTTDKALIQTAIIMVQNEIKKMEAIFDSVFDEQHEQAAEPQEEQEEQVVEEVEEQEEEQVVEEVEEEVVEEIKAPLQIIPTHSYSLRPRKRRIAEI